MALKGHIPWNKGKHSEYMQGANNVFYNGGKIKQTCLFCKEVYEIFPSRLGKRKFCTKNCQTLARKAWGLQAKENNPAWRGGITKENKLARVNTEYKQWQKAVFERDNYTCVECGQHGGELNADHIKPFAYFKELRYELSNGQTLCVPCHKQTPTFGHKAKELVY